MKISLLALCAFHASVWEAGAFSPIRAPRASSVVLRSTPPSLEPTNDEAKVFPKNIPLQRIEGDKTIRTFKLPPGVERTMYRIQTNGRPMKAEVGLWVGPLRKTHTLLANMQDGSKTPYMGLLKFKADQQVVRMETTGAYEYPLIGGVGIPSTEHSKLLGAHTDKIFDMNVPQVLQGGDIQGDPGTVRTYKVGPYVASVQVVFWSKRVCFPKPKSVKAKIEVLQGPNNQKQLLDLHCGGGTQPYHCVISTPGTDSTIRIFNKNYLEFPFEVVMMPYELVDGADPSLLKKQIMGEKGAGLFADNDGPSTMSMINPTPVDKREWWQHY